MPWCWIFVTKQLTASASLILCIEMDISVACSSALPKEHSHLFSYLLCLQSLHRADVGKGGGLHSIPESLSFFLVLSFSKTGFWSPQSSVWVILSEKNKVFLCSPQLIHIPWSIPSQLRSFHVNGVLITPVHGLWKRGLPKYSASTEQNCTPHNIRAVFLVLLLCLSMSRSFPGSFFLLMSYAGLSDQWLHGVVPKEWQICGRKVTET